MIESAVGRMVVTVMVMRVQLVQCALDASSILSCHLVVCHQHLTFQPVPCLLVFAYYHHDLVAAQV